MKVLLIDVNCKYSSTGKIVYDLARRLQENGHTARICYGRGPLVREPGIYKFGIDAETCLHAGLARITGLNGYFSPVSTKRLIRFIDEYEPDVVHIHELHAYFVNIVPLITHLKKIQKGRPLRVLWTFHCEYMYTGKCGHAYECTRFMSGCGGCPALHQYPKTLFFDLTSKMLRDKKRLLSDFDFTVITPSEWLAGRVRQSFLKTKEMRVVHNGIDTEHVFYLRAGSEAGPLRKKYVPEGYKIVLSAAPDIMNEKKGGEKVVELSKLYGDKDVFFVLIGAPEEKRDGNCLFLEKISDQNELARWYSLADVFLICSKRENFPTTCLEAFCCGTPVVGIDEGGTKETVPAPYGQFTDPSAEHLKEALDDMLAADWNKEEISAAGRARYSLSRMYDEIAYERL